MSYDILKDIFEHGGGRVSNEFCQSNYLAECTYIKANRLSSYREIDVMSNFNGMEGMCTGFAIFLIEKTIQLSSLHVGTTNQ